MKEPIKDVCGNLVGYIDSSNGVNTYGTGNTTVSTVSGDGYSIWIDKDGGMIVSAGKPKNPYIPEEIHVNEELKIVVVKWADGTEIKVTCDNDDTFNVDAGFAQALKYKMFGGKTEYKEKWGKIVSRRIRYHGIRPEPKEKSVYGGQTGPSKAEPKCFSCGTECDLDADYCFGCKKIVCTDCAEKYNHFGSEEHGHK